MRPHRSGFQLDTTVCVQVGEAIVYQIRATSGGKPSVDQQRRERGKRNR